MVFLIIPFFLIFTSIIGFVTNSKNPMFILLYIELIIINFASIFGIAYKIESNYFGELFSLFILTVAAVESALLITILVQFFRFNNTISLNKINSIS